MKNAPHDLAARLKSLGFKPILPPLMERGLGDFGVFDDSDGNGPYIRHWLSDKPCPFPEFQRGPIETVVSKEELERRNADRVEQEANEKEREDLMKATDIVRQATEQVQAVTTAAEEAIRIAHKERDDALGEVERMKVELEHATRLHVKEVEDIRSGKGAELAEPEGPKNPLLNKLTFGLAGN